jgi:sn-glycerol 3-phosphate transport system permease protein
MASTSFKSLPETLMFPPKWLPDVFLWENYAKAWSSGPFLQYTLNSLIVVAGILLLQFLTIIPAAYAFARYQFRGSNLLFALTMITLMIPTQLIFLPVYLQFSAWGMANTILSLILPFASSALGIFMLRQAFKQVPEELLEAARLDYASEWKVIRKIMIPMAKPTLATFALLSFISHWNDYFWPLVMTNTADIRTLPVGIASIREAEGAVNWNVLMAGNMLLVAPILVVFLIARKYIIQAFVYFGVK